MSKKNKMKNLKTT